MEKEMSSENIDNKNVKEIEALRNKYFEYLKSLSDTSSEPKKILLSDIYPESESIETLKEQTTDLQKCLDGFRPLNKSQVKNLQEVFDIEYTYNSNRIEGNTLTLRETMMVVSKGMTIGGKTLNEHLEAVNHQDAIDYIRDLVEQKTPISEEVIKKIHSTILSRMNGVERKHIGNYRTVEVRIGGSPLIPPTADKLDKEMEKYFSFYEENKDKLNPVILASEMHERLTYIHPFIDGNGRTARLIMNLVLLQNGYPITIISSDKEERENYYYSLNVADVDEDKTLFNRFILQNVKKSLFTYLGLVSGNIGDDVKGKGEYFLKKIENHI